MDKIPEFALTTEEQEQIDEATAIYTQRQVQVKLLLRINKTLRRLETLPKQLQTTGVKKAIFLIQLRSSDRLDEDRIPRIITALDYLDEVLDIATEDKHITDQLCKPMDVECPHEEKEKVSTVTWVYLVILLLVTGLSTTLL